MSETPNPTNVIVYSNNNSGGGWWLSDAQYEALEAAGWVAHWVHAPDDPTHHHEASEESSRLLAYLAHSHLHELDHLLTPVKPNGEKYLGTRCRSAAKATTDPAAAVAEWERVTGLSASALGCSCCGPPHEFEFYDADGSTRYASAAVVSSELRWS